MVDEQLALGHIKPSTSPWNTPIFVIKKKSGKYQLLHDLRAVNEQMQAMGALRPGMPSPAMLPIGWHLLIIDLKDCFFTIFLHPRDTERFAFTLPSVNRAGSARRFEWIVLPQGMKNSPTLCQLFVDNALREIRSTWDKTIIYHYMDDILLAQQQPFSANQEQYLEETLYKHGLKIATEKIQCQPVWKYLGWLITDSQVRSQKLEIQTDVKTLNDAQKLLGDLQWLRPIVGITNEELEVLRPLLKGTDPSLPVKLSSLQEETIKNISTVITSRMVDRFDPDLPVDLAILHSKNRFIGTLTQCKKKKGEPRVLEWLFTSLRPKKTIRQKDENLAELIRKGRMRLLQILGKEPGTIYLPIRREDLDWWLQHSEMLQLSLLTQGVSISLSPLKSPVLKWMSGTGWIEKPKRSEAPIKNALTVYTDAGRKSQTAAVTWEVNGQWSHQIIAAEKGDSLQLLELSAVVWTFVKWINEPINVVSDSLYVAGIVYRIEGARIKEVNNPRLFELLRQLQSAVHQRSEPYCVIHIRSHKWSEGLGEGNQKADQLVSLTVPLSEFVKAREAREAFRQNAKGLFKQFRITIDEAKGIVRSCPKCSRFGPGLGIGVNPRGLGPNELWQMDVTHVNGFGRLKYVHVTIDTYSKYIWATAQAGEKALHVVRHLTTCFAVMGVPQEIKTDNGPAYISTKVQKFVQMWGVKHVTGIPHSPAGQAIIERTHQVLKRYLVKNDDTVDIQERLARTLFTLNHLCILGQDQPAAWVHDIKPKPKSAESPKIRVKYRDLKTGIWQEPAEVVYQGRGHMCVLTPTGLQWIPSRWTRPAVNDVSTETPGL